MTKRDNAVLKLHRFSSYDNVMTLRLCKRKSQAVFAWLYVSMYLHASRLVLPPVGRRVLVSL